MIKTVYFITKKKKKRKYYVLDELGCKVVFRRSKSSGEEGSKKNFGFENFNNYEVQH